MSEGKNTEGNSLFKFIPSEIPEELVEVLNETESVKIERIVSKGHVSPQGFWYDQDQNEFVLILKGKAILEISGAPGPIILEAGGYYNIDAHVRHRVAWTDPDQETIWLAVHYA